MSHTSHKKTHEIKVFWCQKYSALFCVSYLLLLASCCSFYFIFISFNFFRRGGVLIFLMFFFLKLNTRPTFVDRWFSRYTKVSYLVLNMINLRCNDTLEGGGLKTRTEIVNVKVIRWTCWNKWWPFCTQGKLRVLNPLPFCQRLQPETAGNSSYRGFTLCATACRFHTYQVTNQGKKRNGSKCPHNKKE